MSTIWCWAMRPLPSVNGIVKTSGSVPAARAAVNVGAVQLYSSGSTVIQGYLSSNWPICSYSASTASWVTPGRRAPTTIVTGSCSAAGGRAGAGAGRRGRGRTRGGAGGGAAAGGEHGGGDDGEGRQDRRRASGRGPHRVLLSLSFPRWALACRSVDDPWSGWPARALSDRRRAPSSLAPSARHGPGAARPSRRAEGDHPRRPRWPAGPPRGAAAAARSLDRLVTRHEVDRRARTRGRRARTASHVERPVPEAGLGSPDAAAPSRYRLQHRVRVGGLALDGQVGPVRGLGEPRPARRRHRG